MCPFLRIAGGLVIYAPGMESGQPGLNRGPNNAAPKCALCPIDHSLERSPSYAPGIDELSGSYIKPRGQWLRPYQ